MPCQCVLLIFPFILFIVNYTALFCLMVFIVSCTVHNSVNFLMNQMSTPRNGAKWCAPRRQARPIQTCLIYYIYYIYYLLLYIYIYILQPLSSFPGLTVEKLDRLGSNLHSNCLVVVVFMSINFKTISVLWLQSYCLKKLTVAKLTSSVWVNQWAFGHRSSIFDYIRVGAFDYGLLGWVVFMSIIFKTICVLWLQSYCLKKVANVFELTSELLVTVLPFGTR